MSDVDNLIVKAKRSKEMNTTITIKVSEETKKRWNRWVADNNINKSKTLTNIVNYMMKQKD